MHHLVQNITARLSLRRPQIESLEILHNVLENVELSKTPNLIHQLETISFLYPSVRDFERSFPSLCFALATGVGKTRLMGAFISYLYLSGRSRHFFILAPNLTIYEKLKTDFSDRSNPKYVFRGINELSANPPIIITGEDYDSGKGVRFEENNLLGQTQIFEDSDTPYINIFNISKINATENKQGAEKSKTPRIKRLQESIGESYFDYLSNLPDLVLLMDEAHQYRAKAGAGAINELQPILGIELTATPKKIASKSEDFKNTVYAYSLSEAMEDGYIKEPAVATRKDFKPKEYSPEQIERIKLEDGIHHHEYVKAELAVYARQNSKSTVKPFILVVAQDTEHARRLHELIESDSFFHGRYKKKVAEVHSKQSGAEEDLNIQKLIAVENPKEPTEIVIHVNKLKEGWDVTNLYTIVPLRASTSEILTEQTIGRGLRLPYGCKTGVAAVDGLTIIAHDRFQEIIDRANDPNSIIKKKIEIGDGGDIPCEKTQAIVVPSIASMVLTGSQISGTDNRQDIAIQPMFNSQQEQEIAQATIQVIERNSYKLASSKELSYPEIQSEITEEVLQDFSPKRDQLNFDPDSDRLKVKTVVETVTEHLAEMTIDIPQIVFNPPQNNTYGFKDFNLEGLESLNFQPVSQDILIRQLRTNKSSFLAVGNKIVQKQKPEDYIVQALAEQNLVDYEAHAELLYKLAGQVVTHFRSYLLEEGDLVNVLLHNLTGITQFILAQLKEHSWEKQEEYQVSVNSDFTILESVNYTVQEKTPLYNFRSIPHSKKNIRTMIFEGFRKCCYPLQKFDSVDGELRFAQILEDDAEVLRWMKPAPGSFRIEYKNGIAYEPDFVVETKTAKYLCEPKMASEMNSNAVLAKQKAAVQWCSRANRQILEHGGKPWHYALIPHNEITATRSFGVLMKAFTLYA